MGSDLVSVIATSAVMRAVPEMRADPYRYFFAGAGALIGSGASSFIL
jgi:hypothetical protein